MSRENTGRIETSSVFDRWTEKADENISKRGMQDGETLLLAIQEEVGEIRAGVSRSAA